MPPARKRPRHVAPLHPPPPAGEEFAPPDPVRTVQPSARWRVDRIPPRPGRIGKTVAVGAGADGDPRGGADLSSRDRRFRHPARHRARCPLGAVGDGGGLKMRRARCRDRRIVGRPGERGFYRDAAAGGRRGAVGRAGVAGAARRGGEPERRADALAGGERAVAAPPVRSARAGRAGVGRRAVPRPRAAARPLDHHL